MKVLIKVALAAVLVGMASGAALAEDVLTKAEIESEVLGHEFRGRSGDGQTLWIDVGTAGSFYGVYRNVKIIGKYRLTEDGQWCRRVNNGPELCQTVHRRDGKYVWVEEDDTLASTLERQ